MPRIILKTASQCLFNGAILPDMDISWEGGKIYGILTETSKDNADTEALMRFMGGRIPAIPAELRMDSGEKTPTLLSKAPRFLPFLGGYANLRLFSRKTPLTRKDIFAALEAVGLSRKVRVRSYSADMLARLSLAWALMRDASVLLLNSDVLSAASGSECLREWLYAERACGKLVILFFSCRDPLISFCDDLYHVQGSVLRKCDG